MTRVEQPYRDAQPGTSAFPMAIEMAPDVLHREVSLQNINSFNLEVCAAQYLRVTHVEGLRQNLLSLKPDLIIGGGSNLLLTRDIDGLVLHIALQGISVEELDEDYVLLRAAAGENWHRLVLHSLNLGLGGLENLSLIPGSLGAAPMQNIGAYGVELKDCFHSLQALNRQTLELCHFDSADCGFGYRESVFKHELRDQYIITEVTLKLSRRNHKLDYSYGDIRSVLESEAWIPSPQSISKAVIRIRESKLPDPGKIGNAGSFFKNPEMDAETFKKLNQLRPDVPAYPLEDGRVKVPAAWLIDQAGWKGHRRGNIGVHDRQALVLVNHGSGQGADIWQLAKDIQQDVQQRFGISLHPEVNVF